MKYVYSVEWVGKTDSELVTNIHKYQERGYEFVQLLPDNVEPGHRRFAYRALFRKNLEEETNKVEADLLNDTSDPSHIGELLRNYCFVKEGGAYSCFDLIEGFVDCKEHYPHICKEITEIFDADDFDDLGWNVQCYYDPEKNITVAWCYDGDTTLYIKWNELELINDDCKKPMNWHWYKSNI